MTKLRPGMVYKLSFDEASGPPKKRFRFFLEEMKSGTKEVFTLSTSVGWRLEAIVQEAFRKLRRKLGEVTVIPTRAMVHMWTDIKAEDELPKVVPECPEGDYLLEVYGISFNPVGSRTWNRLLVRGKVVTPKAFEGKLIAHSYVDTQAAQVYMDRFMLAVGLKWSKEMDLQQIVGRRYLAAVRHTYVTQSDRRMGYYQVRNERPS